MTTILDCNQLELTILRLAHQLTENLVNPEEVIFIGLQPRGIWISERIVAAIKQLYPHHQIQHGILDITFYRDDIRKELHVANTTRIDVSIEGKHIVLIDDVLYTGRTIRAALDAILDFGRPKMVELCVLVDRIFNRELPIQPDYFGIAIDTIISQKVKIDKEQSAVILY